MALKNTVTCSTAGSEALVVLQWFCSRQRCPQSYIKD